MIHSSHLHTLVHIQLVFLHSHISTHFFIVFLFCFYFIILKNCDLIIIVNFCKSKKFKSTHKFNTNMHQRTYSHHICVVTHLQYTVYCKSYHTFNILLHTFIKFFTHSKTHLKYSCVHKHVNTCVCLHIYAY